MTLFGGIEFTLGRSCVGSSWEVVFDAALVSSCEAVFATIRFVGGYNLILKGEVGRCFRVGVCVCWRGEDKEKRTGRNYGSVSG